MELGNIAQIGGAILSAVSVVGIIYRVADYRRQDENRFQAIEEEVNRHRLEQKLEIARAIAEVNNTVGAKVDRLEGIAYALVQGKKEQNGS